MERCRLWSHDPGGTCPLCNMGMRIGATSLACPTGHFEARVDHGKVVDMVIKEGSNHHVGS